jgi:hypothetical protein
METGKWIGARIRLVFGNWPLGGHTFEDSAWRTGSEGKLRVRMRSIWPEDRPIWDKKFVIFEFANGVRAGNGAVRRKIIFRRATLFTGKHPTARKRCPFSLGIWYFGAVLPL